MSPRKDEGNSVKSIVPLLQQSTVQSDVIADTSNLQELESSLIFAIFSISVVFLTSYSTVTEVLCICSFYVCM